MLLIRLDTTSHLFDFIQLLYKSSFKKIEIKVNIYMSKYSIFGVNIQPGIISEENNILRVRCFK